MIRCSDRSSVCPDDRLAYGKPYANPLMTVICPGCCTLPLKDIGELFFVHAVPIITDSKGNTVF